MAERIDLEKLLKDRRTCRSFKPDPISEDVMTRLYDAACSAPSAGGFQRISIIEITEPEKKEALARISRNQNFIASAPVNLMFCIDGRRMRRIAEYEGAPYGQDYAICTLWMGIVDASISAQTLVLAAEAEGLRSCYNGNVVDRADEVSELLELPKYVVPAFMLTLGYPRSNGQRSRKYSRNVIVHRETYHDMDMEELYPQHLAKCGTPRFAVNDTRCAQLEKMLRRQYDAECAEKAMARVHEQGYLTAYQYWFGCYYPSNEDAVMTAEDYRVFLKKKGLDLNETGL